MTGRFKTTAFLGVTLRPAAALLMSFASAAVHAVDSVRVVDMIAARPEPMAKAEATAELRKRYETATVAEREALVRYVIENGKAFWPAAGKEADPDFISARVAFQGFVSDCANAFDAEDAVAVFEALYLESPLPDGPLLFVVGLQQYRRPLGTVGATALEELLAEIGADREAFHDQANVAYNIQVTLGHCGDAGLDVFERIGWTSETCVKAIGVIATPRARDMLLARLETLPEDDLPQRVAVLTALSRRLYRTDEAVRDVVRRELPIHLAWPNERFYASRFRNAIAVVSLTDDPYFLPHLDALLQDLSRNGFADTLETAHESPEEIASRERETADLIADVCTALRDDPPASMPVEAEEAPAPVEALPPLEAARQRIFAPDTGVKHWDDEKLVAHRGYRDAVMEISARLEAYDEADSARLQAMLDAAGPVEFKTGDAGALPETVP